MTGSADWFVREDESHPLAGPYSFPQADAAARYLSDEKRNGKAEVVTYVGARGGDPATTPRLFVQFIYIHGKRSFGGRVATYHSQRNLPEIVS